MANNIDAISEHVEAQIVDLKSVSALQKVITFDRNRAHHSIQSVETARSNTLRDALPTEPACDLVCLSHLRWDFVYQRPQHLLGRGAKQRRVFFVEEPVIGEGPLRLDLTTREEGVTVVVPHIPYHMENDFDNTQRLLIDRFFEENGITEFVLWYYTPMAISFTGHLKPLAVVYDCMDELSAFRNAPAELKQREAELFARADMVFTGGQSLYEVKRNQHHSVHAFPSSIDANHFMRARVIDRDPADQAGIPQPRVGFFGVIDERLDIELLAGIAELRPDFQLVIIGPVVKIDENDLPRRANIHYLGGKSYKELPAYLSGWEAAILPFARNESTKFISPTKTPEYLAAGCPVVSTSIKDVVRPYGQKGLVHIADTPEEFVTAIESAIETDSPARLMLVDAFLKQMSWDRTWAQMSDLIDETVAKNRRRTDEADPEPENKRVMVSAAH
jgi:UDP-galactopyranose mutase